MIQNNTSTVVSAGTPIMSQEADNKSNFTFNAIKPRQMSSSCLCDSCTLSYYNATCNVDIEALPVSKSFTIQE